MYVRCRFSVGKLQLRFVESCLNKVKERNDKGNPKAKNVYNTSQLHFVLLVPFDILSNILATTFKQLSVGY